jgi:hypothetical protein
MSTDTISQDAAPERELSDEVERLTAAHEAAFAALADALAQAAPIKSKGINLKTWSVKAHHLHREVSKPDAASRFRLLDAALFDPTHLTQLLTCARAASYVYGRHLDAKALRHTQEARLPKDLVSEARALRTEMFTVCNYVLGRQPEVARLLADIRTGHGYQDLASDLDRLARLYHSHHQALSRDTARYVPEDAARARALDLRIISMMDADHRQNLSYWSDQSMRVATLLRAHYDEVASAAQWLMRGVSNHTTRFPSLFSGQGPRKRPKAPPQGEPQETINPPSAVLGQR